MKAQACMVIALLAAARAAPEARARVVGGSPTSVEEFPYVVSLPYTYPAAGVTVQRCVGALISSWHVLTSAFCFTGAVLDNIKVRAGSTNSLSGGTLVGVADVVKHPEYEQTPRAFDVAVLFLQDPLPTSAVVDVLYLPPVGTEIPEGYDLQLVSWGFEYEGGPQLELLKKATLSKLGSEECAERLADSEGALIDDNVLCAVGEGRGLCAGDAGAPLAIGRVLVGVASHYEDCEGAYPSVFTRVDRFTDWILQAAAPPSRRSAATPA